MSGLYTGMRLLDSPSPTWSSDSSEENEYGETTEKVESAFRSIDAPLGAKRRYGNDDGSLIKIKIPRIEWLAPANKASFDEPMYREYSFDPRSFGSVELVSSSSSFNPIQTEQPSSGAGISASDTRVELPQSESPIASTEVESIAESRSSLSSSSRSDSDQTSQKNKSTLSRFGIRWTKKEIEMCEKMKLEGKSREETAEKLDRTVLSVRNMLVKFNNQRPKGQKLLVPHVRWTEEEVKLCEELKREGKTSKAIAEELGRSIFAVKRQLERINSKRSEAEKIPTKYWWTDEETRICLKMNEDGKSIREIAKKVGKTIAGVSGKLYRELEK